MKQSLNLGVDARFNEFGAGPVVELPVGDAGDLAGYGHSVAEGFVGSSHIEE